MQLNIKNLSKTYSNGKQALKDVSLDIKTGMFGLLGQNGAGKSTLMRTIATLQDADSGDIKFDGGEEKIDLFKAPQEIRKVIGYLPQDFGVYPNVNAQELLLHIANMKGIASTQRQEQVQYLLNKVNLYQHRKDKLETYSGGMRQRFGIAQALLGDPKLIIVDEPTAGLDPMERNRFYNILARLGENKVVILSTHIVEDVSTLCNDMAIIGDGQVLLKGDPNGIEQSLEGKLFEKAIAVNDIEQYKNRYQLISQRFYGGKLLIAVLSDEMPEGFTPKAANLEDVYFKILFENETELAL